MERGVNMLVAQRQWGWLDAGRLVTFTTKHKIVAVLGDVSCTIQCDVQGNTFAAFNDGPGDERFEITILEDVGPVDEETKRRDYWWADKCYTNEVGEISYQFRQSFMWVDFDEIGLKPYYLMSGRGEFSLSLGELSDVSVKWVRSRGLTVTRCVPKNENGKLVIDRETVNLNDFN